MQVDSCVASHSWHFSRKHLCIASLRSDDGLRRRNWACGGGISYPYPLDSTLPQAASGIRGIGCLSLLDGDASG